MKLVILALLMINSSFAQDFCNPLNAREVKKIDLSMTPNYFFKTSADGRYIYYISMGKNLMLDTKTGQQTVLDGNADPVPSADGEILTLLHQNFQQPHIPWKITIVDLKDGVPVSSTKMSAYIGGSYQSVGYADAEGNRQLLYYDEVEKQVVIKKIKKTAEGYVIDRNATQYLSYRNSDLRLPMMSPDGKRFSALNVLTNQTEIYDILPNGQTKLVKSLPFAGGKAAFSYDSKKITFHVARDVQQSWHQLPSEAMYPATLDSTTQIRNVFVYDVESDVVQQVTNNIAGNSYFPIFLGDGRVAYIHKEHDSTQFSIQYSSVPLGPQRSLDSVVQCLGAEDESKLEEMSTVWSKLCTQWSQLGDKNSAAIGTILSLSMEDCLAMVEKSNDPSLGVVCQALNRADKNPVKIEPKKSPGEHILATRCLICHGEDKSWFAKNKVKVMKSVNSKNPFTKMPKGGESLTTQEKKDLEAYLNSFK